MIYGVRDCKKVYHYSSWSLASVLTCTEHTYAMNIIPRFRKNLKNGLFNMTKKYTTPSATPPNPPTTNPSVTAPFNSSKFILKCIIRSIHIINCYILWSLPRFIEYNICYLPSVQNKHRILLPKCPKIKSIK